MRDKAKEKERAKEREKHSERDRVSERKREKQGVPTKAGHRSSGAKQKEKIDRAYQQRRAIDHQQQGDTEPLRGPSQYSVAPKACKGCPESPVCVCVCVLVLHQKRARAVQYRLSMCTRAVEYGLSSSSEG